MASIPPLDVVFSWIPEENRDKLDQSCEYRSLAQIADNILEWDGPVADELTLTKVERYDIKMQYPYETRLQRRQALNRWHEKFGSQATYRHLIIALHKAQKMDYVEVVCQQLGGNCPPATPTSRNDSDMNLRIVVSAQPKCPLSFSESLTPVQLADWLTQELEAKGLTLEASQRKALIDEDINGEAFKTLTDEDLKKDLGFKLGARKNIRGIISSITVSTVMVAPPTTQQPSASTAVAPTVRDPTLTTQALDEALESIVFWYTLGVKVGLPSHKLDMIQHDHQGIKNQKIALYNLWLDSDTGASWSKLCEALWQEDKRVLATQLRAKYISGKSASQEPARTKSSEGASQHQQGSEVMDSVLLECLHDLSDIDIRNVGVILGIGNGQLEGMGEGQRLAEAVSRRVGSNWQWSELIRSLEGAGHVDVAKRITVNKNNIEQPSRQKSGTQT